MTLGHSASSTPHISDKSALSCSLRTSLDWDSAKKSANNSAERGRVLSNATGLELAKENCAPSLASSKSRSARSETPKESERTKLRVGKGLSRPAEKKTLKRKKQG